MNRKELGLAWAPAALVAMSGGFASSAPSGQRFTPSSLAKERGCREGPIKRTMPHYVSVLRLDTAQVAEGIVRVSKVAPGDLPFDHDSHDWNFRVKLDTRYEHMLSDDNDVEDGERRMKIEWEIADFDMRFWPIVGDKFWTMGRWIFDCGHQPYETEIHPPKAIAFTRLAPHMFPGDRAPSYTNKILVFINGHGGYFYDHIGGQSYGFDVSLPPKPSPTAEFRTQVVQLPFGGPTPVLRHSPAGNRLRVAYELSAVSDPPQWNLYKHPVTARPSRSAPKFGAVIAAGWREPVLTKGYRVLRVTFDNVRINKDHDPFGSGEWRLWAHANGEWFKITLPRKVDRGDTVPIGRSLLCTVPEDGELAIQTTGWESDGRDDAFGIGRRVSLKRMGESLDGNDKIGKVSARFTAENNFGVGSHDRVSVREKNEKPKGDFNLSFRVAEVQRFRPGTPIGAAPASAAVRPRLTGSF